MTKDDFVGEMATGLDLSKSRCRIVFDTMIEEIVRVLETGGKYTHPGFGTFRTADTAAHCGRNPASGKKMLYPKKRRLRFKPSDILKDEING